MNYRHIYMQIISAAKNQQKLGLRPKNQNQRKDFPNQYFEFHHILPRSLFPNWIKRESNIVPLTAREHFFCHQLLTKIYPSFEMYNAMWFLCISGKYKMSSRFYEKLKIERSKGFWPGKTIKNKRAMKNEVCFCRFCKKECKNKLSLMNHGRVCKLNPSRQRIEDYAWGHKKQTNYISIEAIA